MQGIGTTQRAWYVVWPGEHGMVYDMAWWTSYGIWYSIAGIAWFIVWGGRHGMVHGMV